jgi:hypothetical protein
MENKAEFSGNKEISPEELEREERYGFRYRVKTLIEILTFEGSVLPNKQRVIELLQETLSLVPPFSQREEEYEDHQVQIDRGELAEGDAQDVEWTKQHPRF